MLLLAIENWMMQLGFKAGAWGKCATDFNKGDVRITIACTPHGVVVSGDGSKYMLAGHPSDPNLFPNLKILVNEIMKQ